MTFPSKPAAPAKRNGTTVALVVWIAEEANYRHVDAFNVICKHGRHVQPGSRESFPKTAAVCSDPTRFALRGRQAVPLHKNVHSVHTRYLKNIFPEHSGVPRCKDKTLLLQHVCDKFMLSCKTAPGFMITIK